MLKEGSRTPWGRAQSVAVLTKGVQSVETAGHGGIKVGRKLNALIPRAFRRSAGWYEEDLESYIVDAFLLHKDAAHAAHAELRDWFPDAWTETTGEQVTPAQSHVVRRRMDAQKHAGTLVAIAAWGDWHPQVPAGMVGICATPGWERGVCGSMACTETWWLVPASAHKSDGRRCEMGFVVDPEHDQPWTEHP